MFYGTVSSTFVGWRAACQTLHAVNITGYSSVRGTVCVDGTRTTANKTFFLTSPCIVFWTDVLEVDERHFVTWCMNATAQALRHATDRRRATAAYAERLQSVANYTRRFLDVPLPFALMWSKSVMLESQGCCHSETSLNKTVPQALIKLVVFRYVTPCGFTVHHDDCRHLTSPTPPVQVVITVSTFRHVNRMACLLLTAKSWLFEPFLTSTMSVYRTGQNLRRQW